jgi:hypothetical protein
MQNKHAAFLDESALHQQPGTGNMI